MAFTPEALKEQIEEAEAAIAAGEAAKLLLPHLKEALSTFEGGHVEGNQDNDHESQKRDRQKNTPKRSRDSGDFAPKYDKSAGELAEDVLRDAGRSLTQRQILDKLAEDGKTFSGAALNLALKKRDTIKRVSAPRDSASKYAYKLVE